MKMVLTALILFIAVNAKANSIANIKAADAECNAKVRSAVAAQAALDFPNAPLTVDPIDASGSTRAAKSR